MPARFFLRLSLAVSALAATTFFSPIRVFAEQPWDPIEPVNRGIFWFNDKFDRYILEPVAQGYDDVLPRPVKKGVSNFFNNLRFPAYLLSDVVQLKFTQAAHHTGRFLVNTTAGVLGLIDVAKDVGLEDHEEDFGTALAFDGIPPGPYLVLPILGPSNLRDAFGTIVDGLIHPLQGIYYFTDMKPNEQFQLYWGLRSTQAVSTRADLIEAIESAREASVDYYLFLQGAYYQHRLGVIYDGNPPLSDDDEFGSPSPSSDSSEPKASARIPMPATEVRSIDKVWPGTLTDRFYEE